MRNTKAILPWLLPLMLVVGILVVAFAPGIVTAILGLVVFMVLGWWVVPRYYRAYQDRDDASQ